MAEWKPCPFCGSESLSIRQIPDPLVRPDVAPSGYFVMCDRCLTEAPFVKVEYGGREGALRRWNQRPLEEKLTAENAELHKDLAAASAINSQALDRQTDAVIREIGRAHV